MRRSCALVGTDALGAWADLVAASDEAVIITAPDGVIAGWSVGAARLYLYPADDVVGQHVSMITASQQPQVLTAQLEAAARGEAVPCQETQRVARSGTTLDVASRVSAIRDTAGHVVGIAIFDQDVTKQRWLAATLDHTISALQSAADEAKEAEARSTRFLTDAAHQLRTPMTGIQGAAEALLRGPPDHDRDRLLIDLVREAARAGRLVSSLLRIARLDSGALLEPAPCDLVTVCAEEADRAWTLAPHLDISLRCEEPLDELPWLDDQALREILANLLDNARRHAVTRIKVSIAVVAGTIEVRLDDDGPGIAPDRVERAFERFSSLDGMGGSGLGLPIARELAQAHGGDLAYEDGAFVLRLPAEAVTSEPSGGSKSAE